MIHADMDHGGTVCRLLRADGSEWRVTDLRHGEEGGLGVDAVRIEDAMPDRPDAPGPGPVLMRLDGEPLDRGDLLQWIGEGGEVVWSMTLPVDQARA